MLDWTALSWLIFACLEFLKTFLEGSEDHIIYSDYIVNRRSFIDCRRAITRDRLESKQRLYR